MLWQLPATQLAGLIRSREISAREAVQAALDRLNDVNDAINAVVDYRPEEALKAADVIDARLRDGGEVEITSVTRGKSETPTIASGLENLVIMKTANSGFEGFIRDVHTTLPETADRLFGTAVRARWTYASDKLPFVEKRAVTRNTLLKIFAEHDSRSVQHTLYAMGKTVLETVPEIKDIELTMPNKHCLLVDLSKFGKTNPNEIFVPTEEPYGYIEATIRR